MLCVLDLSQIILFFHKLTDSGADPGIFERGGPEAIIYKILERGGPKSLKMAFECSFQSLSYKSFANISQKGGGGGPGPLGPSPKSATVIRCLQTFTKLPYSPEIALCCYKPRAEMRQCI